MKTATLVGSLLSAQAAAQEYAYTTTRTVTECFSTAPASFGPPPKPTQGLDSIWTITMPECRECGCENCTFTHQYTVTYDVFYPNGTAKWEYPINEFYPGMSVLPAVPAPTAYPHGFTADLRTCMSCGEEPMSATMTYPRGALPYRQSIPQRNDAVQTQPAGALFTGSAVSPASSFTVPRETGIGEDGDIHNSDTTDESAAAAAETRHKVEPAAFNTPASRITRPRRQFTGRIRWQNAVLDEELAEESSVTLPDVPPPTQRTTPRARDDDDEPKGGVANRQLQGPGVALILPIALMI